MGLHKFYVIPLFASRPHANDTRHRIHIGKPLTHQQRQQRRDGQFIGLGPAHLAAVVAEHQAADILDYIGLPMFPAEEHHHVAGDIDQVAYLRLGNGLHAYCVVKARKCSAGLLA